ncbi:MAG: 3-dehydroquinate synthase [Lachnospiraceae bacterium]|nr:3-dehydroquinate synthase [Lachnospiraceae bacterium]
MDTDRIEIKLNNKKCYDILISDDFSGLESELGAILPGRKRACLFTDSNVRDIYGNEVRDILLKVFEEVHIFSCEAGENSKNLDTIKDAYIFLIENKFNRQDVIIALGGGVCGDMAGFTAATYLRGIDFVQLPTTLLSQVDSSIGGKTGVDLNEYKNMVGAFYMPKLVYINISVLNTLPDRDYSSGIAEVLKSGLIKSAWFYEWMIGNFGEIMAREPEYVRGMISNSLNIKKSVIEKDPFEQGERALLNFGHTLGHALEKYYDFSMSHGECVALGCIAASFISFKRGLLSTEEYYEIRDMFVPFSLPISIEDADVSKILSYTRSDKKNDGQGLKFILLKKTGKAFVDRTVTEDEMRSAIEELIYKEE